jgi:hypothetical protein
LGSAVTKEHWPGATPWDNLLAFLMAQSVILTLLAVVLASQGPGRRDMRALAGTRLGAAQGLFGGGPRAGARYVAFTSLLVLAGWSAVWWVKGPSLEVPGWRAALATACLLAGVWVAALLAQFAALWRRITRDWARRVLAGVLVALFFLAPPILAFWIGHKEDVPPPLSVLLLLTNPFMGSAVSFDPVAPAGGSSFAERIESTMPLGACTLLFLLASGICILFVLWRVRLGYRTAQGAVAKPGARQVPDPSEGRADA